MKIIKLIKKYIKNTYDKILHYYELLINFIKSHHLKAFCKYFIYCISILLYFEVASHLFSGLSDSNVKNILPSTWFILLWKTVKISGFHFSANYFIAMISLLSPAIWFILAYSAYQHHHIKGIKIFLSLTAMSIIWLSLSDTVIQFFLTKNIIIGNPLKFLSYWLLFYNQSMIISNLIFAGFISTIPFIFVALLTIKHKKKPNTYGDARFATYKEVKKAGLFAKKGIFLGKAYGKYLFLDGYEHLIVFAPTGTGKTTTLTMMNLLTWKESCIVSDIKLQLFSTTSKYRESIGNKAFLWNPGSREGISHCYNPLDVIVDNRATRIDEIQKIANILIPDNPKSEPIWQVQSRFLFVALTLYVLDTPNIPKTIGEVVRVVKRSPNFALFIDNLLKDRDDLDEICRYNFLKFLELHDKTRLSILATFESYFELFDNPLIDKATSKSDFDIRKLRSEPTTIYIGITNDNLVRLSPLITIFYQQVADTMTRKVPDSTEPYGVLLLMDEFSALRRMESFHKNIGLYREYHLRIAILIQELSQLYDIYGRDGAKVFINAKVRIAFAQTDEETCKLIESALGSTTHEINRNTKHKMHESKSKDYIARSLLLSQEIKLLSEKKSLIMIHGHRPVYADKVQCFKVALFKQRMIGSISIPSLISDNSNYIDKSIISDNNREHNSTFQTQQIDINISMQPQLQSSNEIELDNEV